MALAMIILVSAWFAVATFLRYVVKHVRPKFHFLTFDVVYECVNIPLIQAALFAVAVRFFVKLTGSEFFLGCSLLLYCSIVRFFPCALTRALDIQPLEQYRVPILRFSLFVWHFISAWGTYRFAERTDAPWIGLEAHSTVNFALCLICFVRGRTEIHERPKTVD